jgi:hypothetical protein
VSRDGSVRAISRIKPDVVTATVMVQDAALCA